MKVEKIVTAQEPLKLSGSRKEELLAAKKEHKTKIRRVQVNTKLLGLLMKKVMTIWKMTMRRKTNCMQKKNQKMKKRRMRITLRRNMLL